MTTRGAHVLDAVVRLVAHAPPEALSIRNVAREAGVSVAQVQYYFRTRDELVLHAFEHVTATLEAELQRVDRSGSPLEVLRRMILSWLPLDAARREAVQVWLAFTARAPASERLAAVAAQLDATLRRELAQGLRDAQRAGQVPAELDADRHAMLLLAVIDGLSTQALVGGAAVSAALEAALDAQLALLSATGGPSA